MKHEVSMKQSHSLASFPLWISFRPMLSLVVFGTVLSSSADMDGMIAGAGSSYAYNVPDPIRVRILCSSLGSVCRQSGYPTSQSSLMQLKQLLSRILVAQIQANQNPLTKKSKLTASILKKAELHKNVKKNVSLMGQYQ